MADPLGCPTCPTCDRALDRCASLVACLKATARALHAAPQHGEPTWRWMYCPDPGCQQRWAILEGRARR